MTINLTNEEAIEQLEGISKLIGYDKDSLLVYQTQTAIQMAIKSLETQQRWIPCSERLPEKQGCYLVTIKWKGSYSGDVYIETNMAVYREKSKDWDCGDVIAWMPEPEPYKESEDNVCRDCYYNDGEVHAECVICNKVESEDEE